MESNFRLEDVRVAVLGTGLIGGSLAMALRGKVARLLAYDPQPETRRLARTLDLADDVVDRPEDAVRHADAVLLAAPVRAIVEVLHRLPQWADHPLMVMDVGSTKQAICAAMRHLPPRFDPIGGHPMAGKSVHGLAHAQPDLFRGYPFILTPLERTRARARAFALALVETLGAVPVWLDPATHDRLVAYTSHMPYLVSLALALSLPEEAETVIGPGWRSMVRLAGSSPEMMLDILATNTEAVLEALDALENVLTALRRALEQGQEETLRSWMQASQQRAR